MRFHRYHRCYGVNIGRLTAELHTDRGMWSSQGNDEFRFVFFHKYSDVTILWIGGVNLEWRKRA